MCLAHSFSIYAEALHMCYRESRPVKRTVNYKEFLRNTLASLGQTLRSLRAFLSRE